MFVTPDPRVDQEPTPRFLRLVPKEAATVIPLHALPLSPIGTMSTHARRPGPIGLPRGFFRPKRVGSGAPFDLGNGDQMENRPHLA